MFSQSVIFISPDERTISPPSSFFTIRWRLSSMFSAIPSYSVPFFLYEILFPRSRQRILYSSIYPAEFSSDRISNSEFKISAHKMLFISMGSSFLSNKAPALYLISCGSSSPEKTMLSPTPKIIFFEFLHFKPLIKIYFCVCFNVLSIIFPVLF